MAGEEAQMRELRLGLERLNTVLRAAYSGRSSVAIVTSCGLMLKNELVRTLSQPGSGRTYSRGGVDHVASAPGEPPAVDTNRLRSSITMEPGEDARGPYVDVGTNVEYAAPLEFGTRYIEPRPFFRPAVDAVTGRLQARIVARITGALEENARRV